MMEIQGVRFRLDPILNEPQEVNVAIETESLRLASLDLQTKLTELIHGRIQGMCLETLPTSALVDLWMIMRKEMERRELYP